MHTLLGAWVYEVDAVKRQAIGGRVDMDHIATRTAGDFVRFAVLRIEGVVARTSVEAVVARSTTEVVEGPKTAQDVVALLGV